MGRRLRSDAPGAWHHVMNRGIARRTIFESREDMRHFMGCVAGTVHHGLLEVHAHSVMTTHFHLLVRSPQGKLSKALQLIQHGYSLWFN